MGGSAPPAGGNAIKAPRFTRARRSAAAALCLAGFCLVTLGALPTALAAILVITRDPELRAQRARRLASCGFRLLLGWSEALGVARFDTGGDAWIASARGRLVVANHPSFLDAVVLLARLPEANCVVKGRLRRHPLFAAYLRAGRYIGNGADPAEVIEQCRRAAARGEPVLIFPEGTRSQPGAVPHFLRGAAQIALRARLQILPVTVSCNPAVLTHGVPWYRMPVCRVRHVISFHPPRDPGDFAPIAGVETSRAARRVTRGMQDYFIRKLSASHDVQLRLQPLAANFEQSLS